MSILRSHLPIRDTHSIRLLTPDDIDDYWALIESERDWLCPWLRWTANATRESCLKLLETNVKCADLNEGFQRVGIFVGSGESAKLIGRIGHQDFNRRHDWCALAYWVAQGHAGQGVVSDAARAFIDLSFDELDMNRIEISCQPDNLPSRRVPERLGFTQEGVLREEFKDHKGNYKDMVLYSLLRKERNRTRGAKSFD